MLKYRCQSKDISVKLHYNTTDLYVYMSPSGLKEVFLNLYLNSLDAMEEGGIIEVLIDKKDRRIIIDLRDTGCGIREDNLHKVFDPFFTTKDEGIGLGLSIVHNIVNEAGGDISVSNCEDGGTRFQVSLPSV